MLARDTVAPLLRRTRRDAVRVLIEAHDGQEGAAEAMGVSQPTVSRILS